MNKLTFEEVEKGKGYASADMREEVPKNLAPYINLAYTDYGGTFFDEAVIEYFKKHYPDNIVSETTSYFGQNAFVFGPPADEFFNAFQKYPLGFEDLEDFYYELEYEKKTEHCDFIAHDFLREIGVQCELADLSEKNRSRVLSALDESTDWDNAGRTMYTRFEAAIRLMELGKPKFKLDYDAWAKRTGQGLLPL